MTSKKFRKLMTLLLTAVMLFSMSLPAFAEGEENTACTKTAGCTLTLDHEGECVLSTPALCTKTAGCTRPAGHGGECVVPACTKTAGCTLAPDHEGDCVLPACTVTAGCIRPAGHGGDCVLPACTKTAGCTLTPDHEGDCVLPACTVTAGCTRPAGHGGDCVLPACTRTAGCTLALDHEGDCVLPLCTVTAGCTRPAGHGGDCVVPSASAPATELSFFEKLMAAENGLAMQSIIFPDESKCFDLSLDELSQLTAKVEAFMPEELGDELDACEYLLAAFTVVIEQKSGTVDYGPYDYEASVTVSGTTTEYTTLATAVEAANTSGGTLKLLKNVSTSVDMVVTGDFELDLNGFTITAASSSNPLFRVLGKLAVKDSGGTGGINAGAADAYCFIVGNSSTAGTLSISGGSYVGSCTAVSITLGTANISGGRFSITSASDTYDYAYVLNCIDANYTAGTAKFNITGGTFENFDPAKNAAEGPDTDFLSQNYCSVKNGSSYTVQAAAATVTSGSKTKGYSSLDAAIAAAGSATDKITLKKAGTLNTPLSLTKSLSIDAAGYKISKGSGFTGLTLASGNSITITNSGNTAAEISSILGSSFCISANGTTITIKPQHSTTGDGTCTSPRVCSDCHKQFGTGSHALVYTSSGSTITERCTRSGCSHSATATVQLKSGASTAYNGYAIKPLEVVYSNGWLGGTLNISYNNNVNPGTATGSISVNNVSASTSFTIATTGYVIRPVERFYLKGCGRSLTFTTNIPYNSDKLTGIGLYNSSGQSVAYIDRSQVSYIKVLSDNNGYMTITLQPNVMNQLKYIGKYTLVCHFNYGSASDYFHVVTPTSSPATGDTANFPLWTGMLFAALLALGGTGYYLRKNRKTSKD